MVEGENVCGESWDCADGENIEIIAEPIDEPPAFEREGARSVKAIHTLSALVQVAFLCASAGLVWFGNLFAARGGAVDPLTGCVTESFSLVGNLPDVWEYWVSLAGAVGETWADLDLTGQFVTVAELLPSAVFWAVTATVAVLLPASALLAVLKFCLFAGRRRLCFASALGLALASACAELTAGAFLGLSGAGFSSAAVQTVALSAAGLVLCGAEELYRRGKPTPRGVRRTVGQAGILVGGCLSLVCFPLTYTPDYVSSGSQAAVAFARALADPTPLALAGSGAALLLTCLGLISVPLFVRRAAVRLVRARAGNEVGRAAVFLLGRMLLAIAVWGSAAACGSGVTADVFLFPIGGVIALASAFLCGSTHKKV